MGSPFGQQKRLEDAFCGLSGEHSPFSLFGHLGNALRGLTSLFWWALVDSNHGPHPYQGCALTT